MSTAADSNGHRPAGSVGAGGARAGGGVSAPAHHTSDLLEPPTSRRRHHELESRLSRCARAQGPERRTGAVSGP